MKQRHVRVALLGIAAASALALGACEERNLLRAFQATSPNELIGGDAAMVRVGDFIMENDRIRVGLVGVESSAGPGIFGGTLADADLRREDAQYRNGRGLDTFAEVFPMANLLTPKPGTMDVSIIDDGARGEQAIVRISGEGFFFLDALAILRLDAVLSFFPDTKAWLRFETDYILEPGWSHVKMVSRIWRDDPVPLKTVPFLDGLSIPVCDADATCDDAPIGDFHAACEHGAVFDATGCPTCACDSGDVLALANFVGNAEVFTSLLGDEPNDREPGIIAGDWVFFGGQNDLFAPGMGYDEDKEIFDALWEARDTFSRPLAFDYMAADGGAVSYGYFTANGEGETDPQVLVPMITSSATAFGTAGVRCVVGEDDDDSCDRFQAWSWERYLAVGKGDIASVTDIIHEVRGTPVGVLRGHVLQEVGEPMANARVFVFRDPDPDVTWTDVREIADANFRAVSQPGLLNTIHADVGTDPVEDGDYRATLPAGTYLIVATNPSTSSFSAIERVTITAGEEVVLHLLVARPGQVDYTITDASGRYLPAKLQFAGMTDGVVDDGDGKRPTYLGLGRLGLGIRHQALTDSGQGRAELEPGAYRLTVSRGPEYGISQHDFTVGSGQTVTLHAVLPREVLTEGWIAGDFHLHAEPSFDSGMKLERRVTSIVAEGVEFAVSTDHDVVTNYAPVVWEMGLQDWLTTAVGVELSTLELGHFIAYPLDYDALDVADHDAPDWICKDGPGIIEELSSHFEPGRDGAKIVAHPRDGFIGYIYQLGVNQTDLSREEGFLQAHSVQLAESTCDFDAMELFNSKRFELVRTPSNGEIILYNRCMERIAAALTKESEGIFSADRAALDAACPEVTGGEPLVVCPDDERDFECAMRHRRQLAYLMSARILERTPEEHASLWHHARDDEQDDVWCDPDAYPDDIPAEVAAAPCIHHPGTFEDWLRWLDAGLFVTVSAASDSHSAKLEPGLPRTYIRMPSDQPAQADPWEVAERMRQGRVMPTYGPFIEATVNGAEPGQVAGVTPGEPFDLHLRVQTASWFGVDRVEVYVSGEQVYAESFDHGPEVIVDVDDILTLDAPDDGDGHVVVVAMGLREENLMRPVYLDIPFGELAIPKVVSLAFGALPLPPIVDVETLGLTPAPDSPDYPPVFAYAVTNAILLDTDGDGAWSRPESLWPAFCPSHCDSGADAADDPCPENQICLPSGVCGRPITGECSAAPAQMSASITPVLEGE